MKILDWNVSIVNLKMCEAIDFATNQNADVVCLQEVTDNGLEHLVSNSDYKTVSLTDSTITRYSSCHLTISSKYKIIRSGSICYLDKHVRSIWLVIFRNIFGAIEKHESLFVDIETPNGVKRIYNLHLTWATGPRRRTHMFGNFMSLIDHSIENIICADLNVFGSLTYYNFLVGLIFGYKLNEFIYDERKWFDKMFKKYKLQNPFSGTISWPIIPFNAQADHILIPEFYKIKNKLQYKKLYGSDHTPYMLELET